MFKRTMKAIFPWLDVHENLYRTYKRYHKRAAGKFKERYYFYKMYKKYHCHVSLSADIGENTVFPHPIGIVIGKGVKIGKNCVIYQNVTIGRRNPDNEYDVAEIGDNVMIGCNAIILGRVKVGANAKIAAGSIVLRDVKANETVHGVVK